MNHVNEVTRIENGMLHWFGHSDDGWLELEESQ